MGSSLVIQWRSWKSITARYYRSSPEHTQQLDQSFQLVCSNFLDQLVEGRRLAAGLGAERNRKATPYSQGQNPGTDSANGDSKTGVTNSSAHTSYTKTSPFGMLFAVLSVLGLTI